MAAADRMVRIVFSAIADALARDETVAIAGFGKFAVRSRAAHQGRRRFPLTVSRDVCRRDKTWKFPGFVTHAHTDADTRGY